MLAEATRWASGHGDGSNSLWPWLQSEQCLVVIWALVACWAFATATALVLSTLCHAPPQRSSQSTFAVRCCACGALCRSQVQSRVYFQVLTSQGILVPYRHGAAVHKLSAFEHVCNITDCAQLSSRCFRGPHLSVLLRNWQPQRLAKHAIAACKCADHQCRRASCRARWAKQAPISPRQCCGCTAHASKPFMRRA